jgi:hypothetical protein
MIQPGSPCQACAHTLHIDQKRSSQSTDPSQGPVGQDLHNGHAGARNVLSIFETGQLASTAHKQLRAAHAREALRGRLMDGELRIGPINR